MNMPKQGRVFLNVALCPFKTSTEISASVGFLAIIPLGVDVLLVGLELLVAALQAYVFAILTCLYLRDALHLH